jgi:hypothetical protein
MGGTMAMTQEQTDRFKLLSRADINERWEEHRRKMHGQVVIEDGQIGFPKYYYWIELNRINSYKKLVGWVTQLIGKEWITRDMLAEFMRKAGSRNNLNIHGEG